MVSDVLLILLCLAAVPVQIPQLDFHLDMISDDFLQGRFMFANQVYFVLEVFLTVTQAAVH